MFIAHRTALNVLQIYKGVEGPRQQAFCTSRGSHLIKKGAIKGKNGRDE
jgi:hypothetical protein